MKKNKSRVLSARLNPRFEKEEAALNVYAALIEAGYTPRQIFTDALLHAAGRTPEMFTRESHTEALLGELSDRLEAVDNLDAKMDALTRMVETSIGDVLRSIKQADPDSFRRFANQPVEEDGAMELSDDFIRNAQKAVRKSFRQQQRPDDEK